MKDIIKLIKVSKTIAIVPHVNPDADAMGSSFALKLVLESMGKTVCIYTDDKLPEYLEFLPYKYRVCEECNDKYDLCICADCGDISRIAGRAKIFENAKTTANLDHHYSNTNYAQANHVEGNASSTGELCYKLFKMMNVEITKEIATCLYTAISADTGGFRYSNTSPAVMRIAAEMIEKGASPSEINKCIFDTEDYKSMIVKGKVMENVKLYHNGKIAVAKATKQMLEEAEIDSKDIDNIVDIARKIRGVEVAISLKYSEKGIKISMRSDKYIDVSEIAAAFGGGGHVRASGLLMTDESIEHTEELIVGKAIECFEKYERSHQS